MITDPFDVRAATQLGETLEQTARVAVVTAAGEPLADLDLVDDADLALTFDEGWWPHVQCQGTAVRPDDLAAIDPRRGHRLHVYLGYKYDDGTLDEHLVADLLLDEWNGRRTESRVNFTAYSDEDLLEDWDDPGAAVTYPVGTRIVDLIKAELVRVFGTPVVVSAERSARLDEAVVFGLGVPRFSVLKSLADVADVWLYCDGLRQWHIDARPTGEAAATALLVTGPAGTVIEVEEGQSREDWGNAIVLEYPDDRYAWASYDDGPLGVNEAGLCVYRHSTTAPYPGAANAGRAAKSILYRVMTRGSGQSIDALAALWVRPGHVVSSPDYDRAIVSRVTFYHPRSLMTVVTRQPEG